MLNKPQRSSVLIFIEGYILLTMVLIVAVPCRCLSLTLCSVMLAIFWSIKAFGELKEKRNSAGI